MLQILGFILLAIYVYVFVAMGAIVVFDALRRAWRRKVRAWKRSWKKAHALRG